MAIPVLFFYVGAASLGVKIASYLDRPECSICGRLFRSTRPCIISGKPVCTDCGDDFVEIIYKGVQLQARARCGKVNVDKMESALAAARIKVDKEIEERAAEEKRRQCAKGKGGRGEVRWFAKYYHGRKPRPRLGKELKTEYFKERDAALHSILMRAALDDCDVVLDVVLVSKTQTDITHNYPGQNGHYTYSVWSASGVI